MRARIVFLTILYPVPHFIIVYNTGLMHPKIVLLHYTDWVMFVNSDDSLYYLSLLARLITGEHSN